MSTGYGTGAYAGLYKGIVQENEKLHFYALKKIWPIRNAEGSFDDSLDIEGTALDECFYSANDLYSELFPDTATSSLTDWLNTYGIPEDTPDPEDAIIASMRTLINKDGRMTKAFLQAIIESYGFTGVTIIERIDYSFIVSDYALPFLATEIDDTGAWVSDAHDPWVFEVHMTGGPTSSSTRSTMEAHVFKMKPAFTMGYFYYDY